MIVLLTKVGSVSPAVFREFRRWALTEWATAGQSFDLFTVKSLDWKTTFISARICHEFVKDSLEFLGRKIEIKPESDIFRDLIVFYAEAVEEVDWSVPRQRRDLFRFLRMFAMSWGTFSASFVGAREFVWRVRELGLKILVFSQGKFFWVKLDKGLMNYCYERVAKGFNNPKLSDELDSSSAESLMGESPAMEADSLSFGLEDRLCIFPNPEIPPSEVKMSWLDWLLLVEIRLDDFLSSYSLVTIVAVGLTIVLSMRGKRFP